MLTGVIIHVGHSAASGHYTSFVKQPGSSKQWYHMDDSHVDTVSENTVLKQRDVYVLFYTRKEVKLEFPSPPPRNGVGRNAAKMGKGGSSTKKHLGGSPESSPGHATRLKDKSKGAVKDSPKTSSTNAKRGSGETSPNSDLSALKSANKANLDSSFELSPLDSEPSSSPKRGGDGLTDVKRSLSYKKNKAQINNKGNTPKKRKKWKAREGAAKFDSSIEQNTLLGNIALTGWNDHVGDQSTAANGSRKKGKHNALRLAATDKMGSIAKSKKRKTRIGFWDSQIDEVKVRHYSQAKSGSC